MIARRWHGVVPSARADEYEAYMAETGVAEYSATPGNQGVYFLRRVDGDFTHFEMFTLWESLDAIRRFAGDDIERARYYERDAEFLVELEPSVVHFDVITPVSRG